MKATVNILLMRMALVLVFLIGILICMFWYPLSITISTGISILDYDESAITFQENVEFYGQLFFYWVISLPCFVVVMMGFFETHYSQKEGKFNIKSAKILLKMALILFVSSIIFLIGNLIFMILEWNMFAKLYYFVGGLGLVFSVGLFAIHKYIANGVADQSEH